MGHKVLKLLKLWYDLLIAWSVDDKYRSGSKFVDFVNGEVDHQLNKRFEFISKEELNKGDYLSYLSRSHRYVIIKLIDFETHANKTKWYKINKYVFVCLDVFPSNITVKELNSIDLKDRDVEIV